MNEARESRLYVIASGILLWLAVSAGGVFGAFSVTYLWLLLTGQLQWTPWPIPVDEERAFRTLLASAFIGSAPGALLCVRLWSRLMRRTGWISAERIKRMSGF